MNLNKSSLKRKLIFRYLMAVIFLSILFFIPAGSLKYWQAWVYMVILLLPVAMVGLYFYRKNPEFLERRMRTREKEHEQRKIVKFSSFLFLAGLIVPGFDQRYQWSDVPLWLVIVSDGIVLAAYLFIFLVFRVNQYAARTVEIEQSHRLIASGPYALVRHPMYSGMILMYLFTPVALGSYWGVIPFLLLPAALIYRIANEEQLLKRDLPGYREYCHQTRYRLIPYVW